MKSFQHTEYVVYIVSRRKHQLSPLQATKKHHVAALRRRSDLNLK